MMSENHTQGFTTKLVDEKQNTELTTNPYKLKSAKEQIQQAKLIGKQRKLFGEFWFENEISFLFAEPNAGKTILGYQIGNSIASGKQISDFELEAEKQQVLYFDFELTRQQLENRYSPEALDGNLKTVLRDDIINLNSSLLRQMEYFIRANPIIKIVIIDNLTWLSNGSTNGKVTSGIMQKLKELKNKYNLSILILGHTPKRNAAKPISQDDLAGSKILMTFCDSAFAIGKSSESNSFRYVKQIKQRNSAQIYDEDNVCVFQITKTDDFLKFDFKDFDAEAEHIKKKKEKDNEKLIDEVISLHLQGLTQRDIGATVGCSVGKVNKIIKTM